MDILFIILLVLIFLSSILCFLYPIILLKKKPLKSYIIVTSENRWIGTIWDCDLNELKMYIEECEEQLEMGEKMYVYEGVREPIDISNYKDWE